ncbi:unnamed protein product [Eruca vesicaria subsp. sativa]|uniref:Uncharacterized protein n=1 Tax=Eruca vesicaria subsp. sativa TaxID=29727 RepID=A0ABC8KAE1_ERUVS|nr:unnamed protein product [Eruca vesicaria subsp. sativa]
MAKKKLNPLEDPPKSSSSEEDEVETLSGEAEEQISDESSSEEEDDLINRVIIPPAKNPKTPARRAVASGSKNPTAVTVASPWITGSKRSSEKISPREVHAKRSKKDPKKPLFQRLFSEEDEISLLQGMIDFNSVTGKSPYEDMDEFYDYIKKSISFEASKIQATEKIRSLRKKYMKKVQRGVESMPKAHDMECFKLSKYIWGSNGMALRPNVKKSEKKLESVKPHGKEVEKEVESDGSLKKKLDFSEANGENVEEDREVLGDGEKEEEEEEEEDREVLVNGKKIQVDKEVMITGDSMSLGVMRASDWFEDSFLVGTIASLGVGERFVKQKWSMVAVETKKKLEEKWKLLQAKEMELVLQKTDFMREVGSVIAEASYQGNIM